MLFVSLDLGSAYAAPAYKLLSFALKTVNNPAHILHHTVIVLAAAIDFSSSSSSVSMVPPVGLSLVLEVLELVQRTAPSPAAAQDLHIDTLRLCCAIFSASTGGQQKEQWAEQAAVQAAKYVQFAFCQTSDWVEQQGTH
jgi:hypothetical protein